jgi:hypothetical protein
MEEVEENGFTNTLNNTQKWQYFKFIYVFTVV